MNNTQLDKNINNLLKELRLSAINDIYDEISLRSMTENICYKEFLYMLLDAESTLRKQKRTERFLRESKLPLDKTLKTFDQSRLPLKVKSALNMLIEGNFLKNSENILVFGKPGSGKTHLVSAISNELIYKDKRIYFTKCNALVEKLLNAKKDLMLENNLKKLMKYDAIILDDFGYVKYTRQEMEVLFTFLSDRYERGSVMITSNLPFSKWEEIFQDPMTTAVAIDRLVHHSFILELNIDSYRMEVAKKRKIDKSKSEINS